MVAGQSQRLEQATGIQEIAQRVLNDAALLERADLVKVNAPLQGDLAAKGLAFNTPEPQPFRNALRAAGFYTSWKQRFGEQAWSLLEAYSGPLA